MPHLDICTYLVQFNWTIISFISLYMIVSVKYLPKIGKILHVRVKKILDNKLDFSNLYSKSQKISILKDSLSN